MSAESRQRRARVTLGALALLLFAALGAASAIGAVSVPVPEIVGAVARALRGEPGSVSDAVIVDVRLPRVVLAALVGAGLAGAGAVYQALFRNPLADPYILGVSSGAGLGATLVLAGTVGVTSVRALGVPVGAFVGAALTMVVVVRLASARGKVASDSLLLAGVAVSYTLAAITSFIMVFARQSMASVVFWMMGGLTAASWGRVAVVAPMVAVGAAVPLLYAREMNLLLLGDDRARELGVPVERFRRLVLAAGSLMVAAAVSVAGLIGFVGLMTPHMVRLVLGPDHRGLLPACLLGGATVMVLADLVARVVLAPIEIPVGIITAVLGGPFFLWLLVGRGRGR